MTRRPDKTLVDYVVIAISPALIMMLVGSLVFFLVEVFYQGNYPGRLCYILALFVFAAVLVGRISIEEGAERAAAFAIPLALATAFAVNRFVEFQGEGWAHRFSWIINCGLIGLIWWCAHKLTWDCTLIDESQDSSGEGLLQAAGLDRSAEAEKGANSEEMAPLASGTRFANWQQRLSDRRRRPHSPGVWVVYFSLAALPLFGIGQWFIPASDVESRRHAFRLLCVYTASGLGLLLTTSFLGLRRYLRQRQLRMPAAMANVWLGIGCLLIVALLIFATLLPRPNAEYAISQFPLTIGSPEQKSSRHGMGTDGIEQRQPWSRAGETREDGESAGDKQEKGKEPPAAKSPDETGQRQGGRVDDGEWLPAIVKCLFYIALLLGAAYWLWRSWAEVISMLRGLRQKWDDFWRDLLGRKDRQTSETAAAEVGQDASLPQRFADFADPFAADVAGSYSPDELVRYSFEAVEAWARENGCPRQADQTPHEFAQSIGAHAAFLYGDARRLADLYCRVAYAPGKVTAKSVDRLRQLWQHLSSGACSESVG